jgi:predicted Zn finger-like uncharacterized protein
MAVQIACTSCQARFNVDESTLGKTVKCPKCQAVFQAASVQGITGQAPAPSAAPPGGGYQPGAPPAPPAYGGQGGYDAPPGYGVNIAAPGIGSWSSTLSGLKLLQTSSLVLLIVGSLINLLQAAAPVDPVAAMRAGGMGGGGTIRMVLGCTGFVFIVTGFVGMCMCLSVPYPPAKKRALTGFFLLIGTIVVLLIAVAVLVLAAAGAGVGALQGAGMEAIMGAGIVGLALVIVMLGLAVASLVFWMLFHVAIADYFQSPQLRSLSITALIVFIVLPILGIGVGMLLAISMGHSETMHRIAAVWQLITNVIQYGLYFAVCNKSIAAIRGGMGM